MVKQTDEDWALPRRKPIIKEDHDRAPAARGVAGGRDARAGHRTHGAGAGAGGPVDAVMGLHRG